MNEFSIRHLETVLLSGDAVNDRFRRSTPSILAEASTSELGKWYLTRGVAALGGDVIARVVLAVAAFDRFGEDNDPHGEHDFGIFEIEGVGIYWKIDYYDARDPDLGAEDPSEPATTERVLTIMLREEY